MSATEPKTGLFPLVQVVTGMAIFAAQIGLAKHVGSTSCGHGARFAIRATAGFLSASAYLAMLPGPAIQAE